MNKKRKPNEIDEEEKRKKSRVQLLSITINYQLTVQGKNIYIYKYNVKYQKKAISTIFIVWKRFNSKWHRTLLYYLNFIKFLKRSLQCEKIQKKGIIIYGQML